MITANAQNGYLGKAKSLFYQAQSRDIVSWTAIVSAHAQHGEITQASRFYLSMPERDLAAWNAMLAAFAQNGHSRTACELFPEMKMVERPDDVSFLLILHAAGHLGEVSRGLSWLASMSSDYGLTPRKLHYSCMVDLLARSGYLSDAQALIDSMPYVEDAMEWTCLLAACKGHKDVHFGALAAKRVLSLKPSNPGAYVMLANVYRKS
ncbi:hypothetical protein SELMODRAFT_87167 [Selaginella moellendorffii]|uniref:Pentacotripeptide-repeat region of PRORP domain-containing protein n=2 Tax=Selaginella moellendorffii TaxID=88036 RepID=D8R721_SELML|nr:hypothetical protein SELMODRAFT_87167 [Selaginella moellendorffii]